MAGRVNHPVNLDQVKQNLPAKKLEKTGDSTLNPLGSKPGVKQNIIYALREFQSSVVHLFKGKRSEPIVMGPSAKTIAESKIGVVLVPDEKGQHVAGFMVNDQFMTFDQAKTASKDTTDTGQSIKHLLNAISTGHRLKDKDGTQKIGSKLYVDNTVLRRQTGVLFHEKRVTGQVITPEGFRERSQTLSGLSRGSSPDAAKKELTQFETRLRTLSNAIPAYKEVLIQHEQQVQSTTEAAPVSKEHVFEQLKTQLEQVRLPELKSDSVLTLKDSFKSLSEAEKKLTDLHFNADKGVALDDSQITLLQDLKTQKLDNVRQQKAKIADLLVDKTIATTVALDSKGIHQASDQLAALEADLQHYGLTDQHLSVIHMAVVSLADVAAHFAKDTPEAYTQLTPKTRQCIIDGYSKGALFVGDTQSHSVLSRMGLLCQAARSDARVSFTNNRITELFSGDLDTLCLMQDHMAKATLSSVSDSAHLDPIIANIIQKTLTGEALDKAKIKLALRICARHLCHELAPALGMKKAPSVLFDSQTIKALTTHPDIQIPTLNIVLGQVMILQHQLNPFPDLNQALQEAGIHLTPEKITSYFDQGLTSSGKVDDILNTLTRFSSSMGKQTSMKTLLDSVFQDRPEMAVSRYEDLVVARQLGNSGMDKALLAQNKGFLGKRIEFGTAEKKRSRMAGITISGHMKTVVSAAIRGEKDSREILANMNELHDQRELPGISPKDIAKLDQKMDGQFDVAAKTFQPIVELVRLGIMRVMSDHKDGDTATADIQTGKHTSKIEAVLVEYGLDSATLNAKGVGGDAPLRALIARECRHFSGPEDFSKWAKKATVATGQKQVMGLREAAIQKPEISQALGLASQVHETAAARVNELKVGEKFVCAWGKSVVVSVPKELDLAQQMVSGGVAIGVSVEAKMDKQFWVEKVATEAGEGINVYFGKETGGKVGLNLEFLEGVASVDVGAGKDKSKGVRLHFSNEAAAVHFIASVMTQKTDAAALGKADLIFQDKGHTYTLSAGASFQVPNPIDKYLPEISTPGGVLDSTLSALGDMKVEIKAGYQSQKETSQNLHQTTVKRAQEFKFSTEVGIGKLFVKSPAEDLFGDVEIPIGSVGFSGALRTENEIGTRFGAINSASITDHISVETTGVPPHKQLNAALIMLGTSKAPELASKEAKAALKDVLKSAKPGDSLRVRYELKSDIRWQVCEMTDPSSAKYNPKKAKELMASKASFDLVGIQVVRVKTVEDIKTSHVTSGYEKTHYAEASRFQVVTQWAPLKGA